ncbi:MAG: hypothetical protein ACK5YR_12275 [Pirellula sp.]|jgi:hypothetical protein
MGRVEYPPLLILSSQDEYREHFHTVFCAGPLLTFDDISVRFRKRDFDHAFFESSSPKSKDDTFSQKRAERMDWVKCALNDPGADIRVGYDNKLRCEATDRRVAIVCGNFVVIIRIIKEKQAEFVTCYLADSWTIQKIKKSKKWPREKEKPSAELDGSEDSA